ncbi:MAG: hypothetical protein AAFN30_16540 [Actinomycetota bacterium]
MMAAAAVSLLVLIGFGHLSIGDLRTRQVVVDEARLVTALAVVGLAVVGVATGAWWSLVGAALGAALTFGIQLVPYRLKRRRGDDLIGRADVRLSIPFGWTLGFHGLGFAFVGFAIALIGGLLFATLGRRRRIPFVPFLTLGLGAGLLWALLVDLDRS